MQGVLILGILTISVLFVASIIDFVLSRQQKNDTNKNSMLAAGSMTMIAAGMALIITIYAVSSSNKKVSYYQDVIPGAGNVGNIGGIPDMRGYNGGPLGGLTPDAQSQLIKSSFDYLQNNPMMAMAGLKAFAN